MSAILAINDEYPGIEPMTIQVTKSDLYSDSSERSAETGRLLLYPIRLGVYSIELEYLGNDSEIARIEELLNSTQFPVTFLYNGEYLTKTMYSSDRVNVTERIQNGVGRHRLSFSLIEI